MTILLFKFAKLLFHVLGIFFGIKIITAAL